MSDATTIRSTPEAIDITVQYRGERPAGESRHDRRLLLSRRLHDELDDIADLQVAWPTVSLAAQTVRGTVPSHAFTEVRGQLEARGLRVDIVAERQVVDRTTG